MKPIDPAELSGLLDGELAPEREAEVRRALASDPKLAAEFERLRGFDSSARICAKTAEFAPGRAILRQEPTVLRYQDPVSRRFLALVVAGAVLLRVVPFAVDALTLVLVLNGIALAGVVAWVVAMVPGRPEHRPTR